MEIPSWIDRNEYPFKPRNLSLPMGKMSYIDQGSGDPVVMVHGNPTWSFFYRKLISGLSDKYRSVAMDHIGFGLSDKPYGWEYLPEKHAVNLEALIDKLGLKNITLAVHDWGGPIGLSYALDNPGNVKKLVVLNTWMWPVSDDPHFKKFSGFMGGAIGRFLIRRFNFFVNVIMKKACVDKSKLTKAIHRHYQKPLESFNDRKGCQVFPKQIVDSREWLVSLWNKRENIAGKKTLILWATKDMAFREKELLRWESLFTNHKTIKYDNAGHFLLEEVGENLVLEIRDFLSS